ncbi:MAG: isoprenylcysteine carboxylmethyltransferase family protein [Pirellulaceae bacterium]
MATHIAARLPEDSTAAPTLANRIHVLLIERRVAISMVLFTLLVLVDLFVMRTRPRNVLNVADPLVATGLALLLSGLLVRSWAAGTLRKVKELVTIGPYAMVRNPLYVGTFLMMAGFCTLLADPLMLAFVVGPTVVLYWLAVRDEEQVLARFFPDEWPAYAARVPRFVPRLKLPTADGWSLAQWRKNHEHNAWLGASVALVGLWIWSVCG